MKSNNGKEDFAFTWIGKAGGVNKRFANRNYNLTSEYEQFRDGIAEACWAMNPGQNFDGKIIPVIEMIIDPKRDSDSLLKPIFDGIQRSSIINNDRQIKIYIVGAKTKVKSAVDEIKVKGWNLSNGEDRRPDVKEVAEAITKILMEWIYE